MVDGEPDALVPDTTVQHNAAGPWQNSRYPVSADTIGIGAADRVRDLTDHGLQYQITRVRT
jgi:hypothetical protein